MKITPASGSFLSPTQQKETVVMKKVFQLQQQKLAALQEAFQQQKMTALQEVFQLQQQKAAEFQEAFRQSLPRAQGGEVDGELFEKWLRKKLKLLLRDSPVIYFGDNSYYLPTEQDINYIWADSKLGELEYRDERFDCDDFAFAFKGQSSRYAYLRKDWLLNAICVGFVGGSFEWSGPGHAANIFVNEAGEVKFIEPSTGKIEPMEKCTHIKTLII